MLHGGLPRPGGGLSDVLGRPARHPPPDPGGDLDLAGGDVVHYAVLFQQPGDLAPEVGVPLESDYRILVALYAHEEEVVALVEGQLEAPPCDG